MTDYETPLVKEAMQALEHVGSVAEQARRAGVRESTWRRWKRGDIRLPLRKPRAALEALLGLDQMSVADQRAELERLAAKWSTERSVAVAEAGVQTARRRSRSGAAASKKRAGG